MVSLIQAGTVPQITWGNGNWLFLDIGFSRNRRSCGIAAGDEKPEDGLTFGDAKTEIIERISKSTSPLHFVIEAPLSVCFDRKGNPKGRRIELEGGKARYWYCGAGCTVMIAAIYLIRAIHDSRPPVDVRLFEGFISFKKPGVLSSHKKDVCLLRDVVKDMNRSPGLIYPKEELKADSGDDLRSAFDVIGLDCKIPPVIKPASID